MSSAVPTAQAAARALLQAAWAGDAELTQKGSQFLGQVSVGVDRLSERQINWLTTLLTQAGMPSLGEVPER
jgi:hypothetical protein